MQMKMVRPIVLFASIFMIIGTACGGSSQISTATPAPPTVEPTIEPSYTPLPTYTPKPSSTPVPPAMPTPTETSPGSASTTEQGNQTPINCVPSSTTGFITCTDNTGNLQVDVPDYWTDVNGATWIYNGQEIGVAISAAPDLTEFQNYFDAVGMFFGASGTFAQIIGYIELLDYYTMAYRGNCDYIGRFDYEDGVYRGKYDQYQNCGGTGGYDAYVLGARDIQDPSTKLILVEIQVYPNDTSTVEQIWGTFYVYF